jgi:hypothetical protein
MSKQRCARGSKSQRKSENHRRKAVRMAAESSTERRILVSSMRQGLRTQPALLVRGSSRRITIMRFRPANIRVINRRDDRLGRRPHCFPLAREEQHKPTPRMFLTRSSISEGGMQEVLKCLRVRVARQALRSHRGDRSLDERRFRWATDRSISCATFSRRGVTGSDWRFY